MKKTIIIGSFLAVFLMLMIQNVGAVEYNLIEQPMSFVNMETNRFTPWVKFNIIWNTFGVILNMAFILFTNESDAFHFVCMLSHLVLIYLWIRNS